MGENFETDFFTSVKHTVSIDLFLGSTSYTYKCVVSLAHLGGHTNMTAKYSAAIEIGVVDNGSGAALCQFNVEHVFGYGTREEKTKLALDLKGPGGNVIGKLDIKITPSQAPTWEREKRLPAGWEVNICVDYSTSIIVPAPPPGKLQTRREGDSRNGPNSTWVGTEIH